MYRKSSFKKMLIYTALAMILLPGLLIACQEPAPPVIRCVPDESLLGEQKQPDSEGEATGQIPLIDAIIPGNVETATFALG